MLCPAIVVVRALAGGVARMPRVAGANQASAVAARLTGAAIARSRPAYRVRWQHAAVAHEDRLRTRQRECGVDLDLAEQFEALEELGDAVYAARAALRR